MFNSVLAFTLIEHLAKATTPGEAAGYSRVLNNHRGPHKTSDGQHIALLPYTDGHWRSLFDAVGRPDILDRPWFKDHRTRLEQADMVYRDLAEVVAQRTAADWLELADRHGIPACDVPTLDQIVNEPERHRGVLSEAQHPVVGTYRSIEPPVMFSATPTSVRRSAPLVAEHTRDILREAGLTEAEIDELITSGVASVRPAPDRREGAGGTR
jgi:crotonobetainyl-CoA:carnitine CoA-transferase CaiB-like acyl-CoA transferase